MEQKESIFSEDLIIDGVLSFFQGVTREDLKSKSRKKEVVLPRQLCMYFLLELNNKSLITLDFVGSLFGRRHHTTVLSSVEKIRDWSSVTKSGKPSDAYFRQLVLDIGDRLKRYSAKNTYYAVKKENIKRSGDKVFKLSEGSSVITEVTCYPGERSLSKNRTVGIKMIHHINFRSNFLYQNKLEIISKEEYEVKLNKTLEIIS